ncbi:LolA family protein [Glacieibacterium frigidum]|uniref:Outer membrane lipoprotein carrier protein LolA n=1 Tax=Glacieibacterium frigidum TaxID=2593303 RepID=A0A552U9F4_9SPHN|nr:outer membrane lipoprotein carrier protein LolA [Glacieibacterium frigidum]TRW14819.1 outer membrane lipoprotein carrier protein LolA [Glacieibacterium frigidum]
MIRTLLLAALVATPAVAAPLDEVAAALAATTSMTARFTQTASDGRVATGRMQLVRPGKIRFDYDKSKLLIVADGRALSMIDYKVGQVSQWPIRNSPLAALLDPAKDLARVARVVEAPAGQVRIAARDPKRPDYGTLTMVFVRRADAPGGLALAGWTALDAQNNRTEVVLNTVRSNVAIPKSTFTFRDPRIRTPGRPG